MKPEWQGLRERPDIIELSDYPVQELSNYIRWLYSGNIPIKQLYDTDDETRERRAQEADEVFASLAESYAFGEKIVDAKYKNAVLMAMLAAKSTSGWNLGPNSVDVIYRDTPDTSRLRRFFADSFAIYAYDDSKEGVGWMSYLEQYPKEALVDAIRAMVKTRPIPRSILYHDPNWYLEQEDEEGEERDERGNCIMSQSDDQGSDCSSSIGCSEVSASTKPTEGSCISDL